MLAVQCYLPAADCVGETGVMLTRCICCIALNVRYNQPGANHWAGRARTSKTVRVLCPAGCNKSVMATLSKLVARSVYRPSKVSASPHWVSAESGIWPLPAVVRRGVDLERAAYYPNYTVITTTVVKPQESLNPTGNIILHVCNIAYKSSECVLS